MEEQKTAISEYLDKTLRRWYDDIRHDTSKQRKQKQNNDSTPIEEETTSIYSESASENSVLVNTYSYCSFSMISRFL
jgi:hypothetical protein